MWKRRDGKQNGEIGAGRGLALRLVAPMPLALIDEIAGPDGRMRAAPAVRNDSHWKES
jgi:hypothetical protein